MDLECEIAADGATLRCAPDGLTATSATDEGRVSRMPDGVPVARAVLDAHAEPGRMMEYVPAPRAGVFRVTWKPVLEVAGVSTAIDVALLSVRDHRHGRQVMCTLDVHGWFEAIQWAKSTLALDPTPVPEGIGYELLRSLWSLGGGGRSIKVSHLYRDVERSSRDVLLELQVLADQGFVESTDHSPPAYRLTRKGAEALFAADGEI